MAHAGARTDSDYFPYVPQSGPEFVPLNAHKLPRGVRIGLGVVFLIMAVLGFVWATI